MVKYYKTKNLDSYYLEMVVPFVYTEEEYNKLEERVKFLEEENNNLKNELMEDMKYETKLEQENRKLKEERDFFKEQAILWRKDYKNEYEKNKKLEERIEELETDYDRLKVAFEDVVSGK